MFENREIDGWFVKSERLQGKKHRNTCCIPRIFDAAAAAFCRKRRLFRFFKQPLEPACNGGALSGILAGPGVNNRNGSFFRQKGTSTFLASNRLDAGRRADRQKQSSCRRGQLTRGKPCGLVRWTGHKLGASRSHAAALKRKTA